MLRGHAGNLLRKPRMRRISKYIHGRMMVSALTKDSLEENC